MSQAGWHHGGVKFLLGDNRQLIDVKFFSVDSQVRLGVAAAAHRDSGVSFSVFGSDHCPVSVELDT